MNHVVDSSSLAVNQYAPCASVVVASWLHSPAAPRNETWIFAPATAGMSLPWTVTRPCERASARDVLVAEPEIASVSREGPPDRPPFVVTYVIAKPSWTAYARLPTAITSPMPPGSCSGIHVR